MKDFKEIYKEYRMLFPDAEDPAGLFAGLGPKKAEEVIRQAVEERKKIVFRYSLPGEGEEIDGFEYELLNPE